MWMAQIWPKNIDTFCHSILSCRGTRGPRGTRDGTDSDFWLNMTFFRAFLAFDSESLNFFEMHVFQIWTESPRNFFHLYITGQKYELNCKMTMNYTGLYFKYSKSSNNYVDLKLLDHGRSSNCDFFHKWLDFMTFIFFRDFFEGDFLNGPVTRDSDFWLWRDFFEWILTSDSQF